MEAPTCGTAPFVKKPLWVEGEVHLGQNFMVHERYIRAQVDTSLTEDNPSPEPLWLAGEKLLCQKFFIHNTYIHTYINDIGEAEGSVKKSKKKQRMRNRPSRRERYESFIKNSQNIHEEKDIQQIFTQYYNNKIIPFYNDLHNDCNGTSESLVNVETPLQTTHRSSVSRDQMFRRNSPMIGNVLTAPGNAASSLLSLLNYFSHGMEELFPDNTLSDKLIPFMSQSDSIHLMLKLHTVLSQLDKILEDRVTDYMNKEDIDISLLTSRGDIINEIKKTYILKYSKNESPKAEKKVKTSAKKPRTPYKMIINKRWSVEASMVGIYESEHKIQFITNFKYMCSLCGKIFYTNPASHIITPSHINALSEIE